MMMRIRGWLTAAWLAVMVMGMSQGSRGQTLTTMIAPADGASNVDPGASFSWTSVSDAQAYYVYVGSARGLKDVYNSGSLSISVTSLLVPGLHANTTYYIRLWTEINGSWGSNYVDSGFTTGVGTAHLTNPLNGATNVDPYAAFSWNAIANAQSYTLNIGSAPGGADVFTSGAVAVTSMTVPGLMANTTYYARLYTQSSGGSTFADSSFTLGTGLAHLITPANGAVNVDPSAGFSWNGVVNAQVYYLYIGTTVGAKDVWSSGAVTVTSVTASGITAGKLYYARMWTEKNNAWFSVDTSFTTGFGTAHLTTPANGATNVDPYLTANWTTVANAQSYAINVGSAPGGSDVYSSGPLTTTSQFIPGLQQNTTYSLRLFTTTSQGTSASDSSFTTGLGMAHMLSPVPGASAADPFAAFQWTSVPGAQAYYLIVSTAPGLKDVFNSATLSSIVTQLLVYGMRGGQTYYVRLDTEINNKWHSALSSFTTAPQPLPSDANSFRTNVQNITAAVRAMAQGKTNVPVPGTLLAAQMVADGHKVLFCTDFSHTLVQELIAQRISARVRGVLFDGNNTESHSMNEYYDPFLNKWVVADSDFAVVYYDASSQTGFSVEDISNALVAQNWGLIPITYVTNYGSQLLNQYYMDPIVLYLNPMATGAITITLPMANSPTPFLLVHSPADIGTAGLYLFSFANSTDTVTIASGSSSLQLGPSPGIIYSKVVSLAKGWSITSMPANLQILSIKRVLF
jgi:hypothetical protein